MRYLSLRWRLMLSYALLAIVVVSSVGALALWLIQRNMVQRETEALQANARAVSLQAAPMLEQTANVWALRNLAGTASFLSNARVRILDRQGTPVADSGDASAQQRIVWMTPQAEILGTVSDENVTFGIVSDGERVAIVPIGSRAQMERLSAEMRTRYVRRQAVPYGYQLAFETAITPTMPVEDQEATVIRVNQPVVNDENWPLGIVEMTGNFSVSAETMRATGNAFTVAALVSVALAGLLGMLIARGVTSPLRALAGVASRMGEGDLTARAAVPQRRLVRDETAYLASQFNDMASRLDSSFRTLASERDALRHFVADASHELRTPITALKTYNELLQTTAANDAAVQSEFLASSQQQIERLEWITANLLDLSRIDAGLTPMNRAPHAMCEILGAAARPFQVMAARKGVHLSIDPPPATTPGAINGQVFVNVDRPRLEMALSNLMDNALKHTPAGGTISIGGTAPTAGRGMASFYVRDTGPGIPAEIQPHIFERFYRGPKSQGSGLGLAIVRSVANAHGGTAAVESTLNKGSTFTITLPVQVGRE